jgi:type VI secretion system protein ImpA
MPAREDLLVPISGNNPSGQNLRYAPVYAKIEEARRKEDPIAQGDWQRPLKEADYRLVIKLSVEALTRSSKDLKIAAWLTEALVYQEGFAGLATGFELLRGLLENFWDTVYPELEDGDMELRAAPLSWVGDYRELELAVRSVPFTNSGFNWLKYKESRTVGYETDIGENETKRQARSDAINQGKLTAEEFDEDVKATPLAKLDQVIGQAETALESLRLLDEFCQEKFANDAPSFRIVRSAVEDVQHTAKMLAGPKRESEPEPEPEEPPEIDDTVEAEVSAGAPGAGPRRVRSKAAAAEPVDHDDAIRRIVDAAAWLRREDPRNPVPYLALRALRWGELRSSNGSPNPDLMEAPPTEIRQQLKKLLTNAQWDEVLQVGESAMGLPCGRAWLDLQRYVVVACVESGEDYKPVASAIQSQLRGLLQDFPQLPSMTLLDDTATANSETQEWLNQFIKSPAAEREENLAPIDAMQDAASPAQGAEAGGNDAYDLALEMAQSGNLEEAMKVLSLQIGKERSGRGRFLRRMQFAQLCILARRYAIALPILQDLAHEIETRNLEGWEQPEQIAQTLALLLQSMQKLRATDEEKQKVYAQICRLDPLQAAHLMD